MDPHSDQSQPTDGEPALDDGAEARTGIPTWAKMAAVFVVLVGGVVLLLTGGETDDPFVYSKLVDEVVANPAGFADRELRVEGDLKQGSVRFREDPCEWRFVLEKQKRELAVEFPQCVVPDTFRDGMGISVTVQGHLKEDGSFLASQVIPRCPSKYEMKQREEAGESMPHDVPAAQPTI